MKKVLMCGVAVALAVGLATVRAQEKREAPKPPAEYQIGEMHVQTLQPINYAYGSQQATFEKLLDAVNAQMPLLNKAIDEGKVKQRGPVIFIYKGVDGNDMSKPFTLEVGAQVSDDAKEGDGLKVKKLGAYKCATVVYIGTVSNMSKVYEKLVTEAMAAGYKMTGESREMYMYWEGPDSKNNVVQVQMGIE